MGILLQFYRLRPPTVTPTTETGRTGFKKIA